MTIYLGTVVVGTNDAMVFPPPLGFNSVGAVRVSNAAQTLIYLNNVNPQSPGQQYLLANQQNVYVTTNINVGITAQASDTTISSADLIADITVEWSTDPQNDFPGTYPVPLTVTADVNALTLLEQGLSAVEGFFPQPSNATYQNLWSVPSGPNPRHYTMFSFAFGPTYVPAIRRSATTNPGIWQPLGAGTPKSLLISFQSLAGGQPCSIAFGWYQTLSTSPIIAGGDTFPTGLLAEETYNYPTSQQGVNLALRVPYKSAVLVVSATANIQYLAESSTIATDRTDCINNGKYDVLGHTGFTANVNAILVSTITGFDVTYVSGQPVSLHLIAPSGGRFGYFWYDRTGALQQASLGVPFAAAGESLITVSLPVGMVQFFYVSTTTVAGSADVILTDGGV